MILTTIALIWMSVAAVFVLALCAAAAKPVPQSQGWAHAPAGFSVPEESAEDEGTTQVRLFCGRSLRLRPDQTVAALLQSDALPAIQRGGMTSVSKSDAPDRAVSF